MKILKIIAIVLVLWGINTENVLAGTTQSASPVDSWTLVDGAQFLSTDTVSYSISWSYPSASYGQYLVMSYSLDGGPAIDFAGACLDASPYPGYNCVTPTFPPTTSTLSLGFLPVGTHTLKVSIVAGPNCPALHTCGSQVYTWDYPAITINVVPPQPNLVAAPPAPTSGFAGESITFSSSIQNNGTLDVTTTFSNVFQVAPFVAGFSLGTGAESPKAGASIAGLLKTQAKTSTYSWTPPTTGTYFVRACADNSTLWVGAITESNESDNCSAWTTVSIAQRTGTINVSSNIMTSWSIAGPATIAGSGTSQTSASQPVGDYTITWAPVSGYTTPAPQTLTLADGGSVSFSANYVQGTGAINVSANIPEASWTIQRPKGFKTIKRIIPSSNGGYAFKTDGSMWSWDSSGSTQVNLVSGSVVSGTAYNNATLGSESFYILKSDGTVWSWGKNFYGQLGDGTKTDRATPAQISGLSNVVSVSFGGKAAYAVKSDGTVWSWGNNISGQLGDGTQTDRLTPVQVVGPGGSGFLAGVASVSAMDSAVFALKSDGTVWAWGNGVLGNNPSTMVVAQKTPVQVVGVGGVGYLTGVVAISGSFALKSDGTVYAWGADGDGQLGNGAAATADSKTPVQVLGVGGTGYLSGITKIRRYGNSVLVLKSDGTVYAWGDNFYGQIGDGSSANRPLPVQVKDESGTGYLGGIVDIEAKNRTAYAIAADGTAWAWGFNNGSLGNNTNGASSLPSRMLGGVVDVVSGSGLSASYAGYPADSYSIVWGPVTNYLRPSNSSQVLSTGGTIIFTGNYKPGPDLTASDVKPSLGVVGTNVNFLGTISNIGIGSTSGGFKNFFQVATASNGSGTITDLAYTSMATLGAGSTNTASKSYKFTTAGTYSVRVCADKKDSADLGSVTELKENNNCSAWFDVVISDPPPPPSITESNNCSAWTKVVVGAQSCTETSADFIWASCTPSASACDGQPVGTFITTGVGVGSCSGNPITIVGVCPLSTPIVCSSPSIPPSTCNKNGVCDKASGETLLTCPQDCKTKIQEF